MSDYAEHTLKLASKTLQKTGLILIPLFLLPPLVMAPPLDGVTFPEHIVLMARIVAATSLVGALLIMVIFMFYRMQTKI